jgi:anti-sigma regulatory factor (Ser/Thr protein kinase)
VLCPLLPQPVVADLSLRISGGLDAPAEARSALRRYHPELPPELMQVIVLLVSELVSNSVRHADADSIGIRFEVMPHQVRVEVADEGPGFKPAAKPIASKGAGGWGLRLVDEMASRWGATNENGFCVWFELDR